MRIGYITCVIYNTPDNLRIAWEDNLIDNYDQQKIQVNHVSRIPDVSESCALNLAISKSTLSFVPSTSSTALIPSLKGKL